MIGREPEPQAPEQLPGQAAEQAAAVAAAQAQAAPVATSGRGNLQRLTSVIRRKGGELVEGSRRNFPKQEPGAAPPQSSAAGPEVAVGEAAERLVRDQQELEALQRLAQTYTLTPDQM